MKNEIIKNKAFMKLWLGSTVSNLGDSMDNIVFIMLAIKLTNSPSATGILMMIISLPNFIFSILGGTVADNYEKKKIMLYANLGQGLVTLIILILVMFDKMTFLALCILLFIVESLSRFNTPAYMALLPSIVEKKLFVNARAFSLSTQSVIGMVGPSIAAILINNGYTLPIAFDAFSYIFAAFMIGITSIKVSILKKTKVKNIFTKEFMNDIIDGFKYLKLNKNLLSIFSLIFFINLFLGFFDVALPFYVKINLRLPTQYYGYLKTMAIGTFVFASFIITKSTILKPGKISVLSIFPMGISLIVFGLSKNFFISSIFWIVASIFRCFIVLMLNSFYGLIGDDQYRGRIMGMSTMLYATIVPISNGLSGIMVQSFTASVIFILSGFGLLLVAIVYLFNRSLLQYKIN
ncbi:MFS transporter [Clostridium guangxiense]|uniref:MFS transporter n=2 Tax=Clostridium TaxID=1485 RepID=UPI001E2E61D6|nr:MFS transporter [Clostridium guangxiense]MCD2348341.1 MFS transporter [Clostridium guangxiense]